MHPNNNHEDFANSGVLTLQQVKDPDGELSAAFLQRLKKTFSLTGMVETGTYLGDSTAVASAIFPVVYSIELSEHLAMRAARRFAGNDHVHVLVGDSASVLASVVPRLSGPTLFWLDGHYSEGNTARGSTNTPILQELRVIAASGRKDAIILIDDLRLFDKAAGKAISGLSSLGGYPSANEIHVAVLDIDPDYQFFVFGDVMLAFPGATGCQVSPLVAALTVSRLYDGANLPLQEVLEAEALIGGATGGEREVLRALPQIARGVEADGFGLHYRLWSGIALLAENKALEASREFQLVCLGGFPHWRAQWYLAVALNAAGDTSAASEYVGVVTKEAPDFEPARRLLQQLSAADNAIPKTASKRPAFPPGKPCIPFLISAGLWLPGAPLRLHLGCGEYHLSGYINIDYPPSEHTVQRTVAADIFGDITKLFLPAHSVDEIRLHHVFEHFDRPTALALLGIWHEWLRPGGKLVIETPDVEASFRLMLDAGVSYEDKQAVLRHVFGSHEAFWAVHWDGWYADKYRHVLSAFGFADIEFEYGQWQQSRNITVRALKRFSLSNTARRDAALSELSHSLILSSEPSEQRLLESWVMKYDALTEACLPPPAGKAPHHPLVSVFMPAYNREKYLAATLDSLLAQTFSEFELIIADDGSVDNTLAVARAYAEVDPRIRVLALSHKGEVAARNEALRHISPDSEYLLNHDSDDISLPDKLSQLVQYLKTNTDVAIVGCFAEYFDDQGRLLGNPPIESRVDRIRDTFVGVNSMINSAALIRRCVFEQIGGYRESFRSVDDYDFFARALLAGFNLANIPEVLHRIRVHPTSVSSTRAKDQQVLAAKVQAYLRTGRVTGETAPRVLHRAEVVSDASVRSKKRQLKIVHTVEFYAPHVGGAEMVVQQISERLARRGHHVTVATSRLPERGFKELNGVQIRDFAVTGKLAEGISGDAAGFQQFLRDHSADAVMNYAAQVWPTDLSFDLLTDKDSTRSWVLAPCGYSALVDPSTLRWPHFRDYFEKVLPLALPKYDAVVYHSAIYKDFLFGQSLKLANGLVIPNGTDEEEFSRPVGVHFREKYQISSQFIGLCVANFYEGKGQERIIECVRQMARPDFTMVFIGKEGNSLQALRDQATGLNVRFLVSISREDTVAAFRSSDLFLFGSHIEASPLVIIEAKAARLPFISTDCGNVREWKGGIVCAPDKMAAEANRLLDDGARRKQLADEGWQEWKSRLTWEAVTDQWEDLYLRLHHAKGESSSGHIVAHVQTAARQAKAPTGNEVVVRLQGGMGNQMFQYAAGLCLARRRGAKLKLDQGFLLDRTPRPNFTYRDYDLDLFVLDPECEVVRSLEPAAARTLSRFGEKHFHYDPQFENLPANVYLDGYWQSPRYFAPVLEEVRNAFTTFSTPLSPTAQALSEEIRSRPSVCLNVRRGDYVANPVANAFHGVCDQRYFAQAVTYVLSRVPDAHFYIFSDDVNWCRTANLVQGAPFTIVSHQYAGDRFASYLQLMMACRHFVIPNSTFAWWAAYLGHTHNSIVIVPTPWFSDLSVEYIDLVPEGWSSLSRNPGPVAMDDTVPPKVSVVIPCYKQARFLQEAVESVVGQTFGDWEVVVVNDGSPDNTSAVTREIIARHPERRIRLLEKANGGLADARNAGIKEARGSYILPLDSDDRLHSEFLAKSVAVLEGEPSVGIAYTDIARFGALKDVVALPDYDFTKLLARNQLNCCSLFRREAWVAAGGYNPNMKLGYEDWDFWIACGEKGFFGKRIPDALFYYRVKDSSMFTKALQHHEALHAQIVLNHPGLYTPQSRERAADVLAAAQVGATAAAAPSLGAGNAELEQVRVHARELFVAEQWKELGELCADAVLKLPLDADILFMFAHALANLGDVEQAHTVSQKLVELRPEEAEYVRLEEILREAAGAQAASETIRSRDAVETRAAPAGMHPLSGRRVLIYTDDPGQGGAAHYNDKILRGLVASGVQTFCAQPLGDSPLIKDQVQAGVVHCWTAFNPVVDFARSLTDEADARRIFELTTPDFVYFSDCCALSHVAAKSVARSRGIPFAVICHSEASYLAERFREYLPTLRLLLDYASEVIAVSASSLEVLRAHFGLSASKGKVIHSGCGEACFEPVSPQERASLRQELGLRPEDVVCFTAARMDAAKGFHLQLEAARVLHEKNLLGPLHFVWAGEGDQRTSLEEKARAYSLADRVHFLGYRWDVCQLMGASDIFVLSTFHEALPLCIMEAMARGLPVVASAVGGIPEELGDTGKQLPDPKQDPARTVIALAETLASWSRDAQARKQAGEAGRERARAHFRASVMVERTLSALGDACTRSRAPQAAEQEVATDMASAPSGELFGPDEVKNIQQIVAAYLANPLDPATVDQLHSLRQALMSFLVEADVTALESQFAGSLGEVYRTVVKSGIASELPSAEADSQLSVLDEAAGSKQAGDSEALPLLLARMLRAPAHRGSLSFSPESIPAWFLDDYLLYLLHAPKVFVAPGEADEYAEHVLKCVRGINDRVRSSPNDRLTVKLASSFALQANFIPLYFGKKHLRELAEKRAAILEFALLKTGASIDAKLPVRPKNRKKIKVGFLAAHFGRQTETHVTLSALHLDRSKFEICLFAITSSPGPLEERCRSFADSFVLLPEELRGQVEAVRKAALDILIIGTNVTAVTNQAALMALHRLAPVQLATYCSPVTTGMRHIDGYLSGTLVDFPGVQDQFTEKIYFCEGPPGCLDYTVEPPRSSERYDRAALGLAEDDVVFVNAASCFKILPEQQDTWARILKAVPHSRLVLLPFNPNWASAFPVMQFEQSLAAVFEKHGLERDRFVLVGSLPSRADVKALLSVTDVYLDTYPFSGSISVIDPLELAVPPVAWAGETHHSRMAAALLKELGMTDLIADDETSYIAKAVELGSSPEIRRRTREQLRERVARKPAFIDPVRYGERLGSLLERLVRK